VFASAPLRGEDVNHDDLFLVLECSHRLLVPSRPLFAAMSYALEEAFVRSPGDAALRERARSLADQIRDGFVQHHLQRTPEFQTPLTDWEDDSLNVWVIVPW
jgi:meiotically up-regulated gene 157 (Mug157) protein